jgi:hypothetical protein
MRISIINLLYAAILLLSAGPQSSLAAPSSQPAKRSSNTMIRLFRRSLSTDQLKEKFEAYSQPLDQTALSVQRQLFSIGSVDYDGAVTSVSTLQNDFLPTSGLSFNWILNNRTLLVSFYKISGDFFLISKT